jgi:hypothetical protein
MTFVDNGHFRYDGPRFSDAMYDVVNSWIVRPPRTIRGEQITAQQVSASYHRTSPEQRLVDFQSAISDVSMHLPTGFATGLNRQFANMFDDDAWEAGDELPVVETLRTFLTILIQTNTQRRPGIGTNGRGSITAAWTEGDNRLTVESDAAGRTTWVLTRIRENGGVERAAGDCLAARLLEVLYPYKPGVWFGQ